MRAKRTPLCLTIACLCAVSIIASAQEVFIENSRQTADPGNAMIEGRILLPDGRTADFNVKIILSEVNRPLITAYTNKHAEFRFQNLRAGEYYVQAIADEKVYEPVTQKVRIVRGDVYELTMTLRKKAEIITRQTGAQVVSASEFDQSVPPTARKEYERGVKSAGKGDLSAAIDRLQRAVAIYPDYLAAHNDLGAQYLKLKQFDRAAEHFRTAVRINPRYFNAVFNIALVMIEQKDYAGSVIQLNQALAIDKTRPAAHFWLGIALLNTGELPGADRSLSKALITGGSSFVAAHYYLAQVHLKNNNQPEAVRELKAYLEEAPRGEFASEAEQMLKSLPGKTQSNR